MHTVYAPLPDDRPPAGGGGVTLLAAGGLQTPSATSARRGADGGPEPAGFIRAVERQAAEGVTFVHPNLLAAHAAGGELQPEPQADAATVEGAAAVPVSRSSLGPPSKQVSMLEGMKMIREVRTRQPWPSTILRAYFCSVLTRGGSWVGLRSACGHERSAARGRRHQGTPD